MISKISYIKLIREDIRHRGWLAALSGVLLFLSMPVYTLICRFVKHMLHPDQ